MQLGPLLWELMGVSGVNQADLAKALAFSTSELSKYVNGSRLPAARNIRGLIGQSAMLFAHRLWEHGGTAELRTIFPLMHMPKNQSELTVFLRHALSLAYRESRIASQEWTEGLNTPNMVLSGWEEIYHHLLISLSFAMRERKEDLHVYFTLGFFLTFIRSAPQPFPTKGAQGKVYVHVLVDEKALQDWLTLPDLQMWLAHIEMARKTIHFSTWSARAILGNQSFCYLEGNFALMINGLVPTAPVGMRMEDPRFLMEFGQMTQHLMRQQLSYNREEALAIVRQDGDMLLDMLAGCQGIYAFGNFGFLAQRQHLDGMHAPEVLKDFLARAMDGLMHKPIPMLISISAVDNFSTQSRTMVPLAGWMSFDKKEQVAYMAGFERLMDNPEAVRIHLALQSFPWSTLLVLEEGLLIYLPEDSGEDDQFMLLPRSLCGQLIPALEAMTSQESLRLERKLWDSYMKELPTLGGRSANYPASLWAPLGDLK